MRFCGLQVLILASRDQSTTKPSESPHEKAPGRLFRIFTSLLLCLDEDSFHTLAVIASGIERILADIVTVTLKPINSIHTIRLLSLVRNMTLPFSKALTHRISSYLTFSHFSSVFTKKPSSTTYGLWLLSSPKSRSVAFDSFWHPLIIDGIRGLNYITFFGNEKNI